MNDKVLGYIGKGSAIPNIPARDLTDKDLQLPAVVEYGGKEALIRSGLYLAIGGKVSEFIMDEEKRPRKS